MTALFSVDCTCGRKVVIDSDTMRKVEAGVQISERVRTAGRVLHDRHATGFHDPLCSCGNCPGGAQSRCCPPGTHDPLDAA